MGSSDTQGELWGRDPANWRDLQEGFSIPLWDAMLTATGIGPGARFLDAGCGAGGASVMADGRGAAVTGVDASDPLLEVARHRVPTGDFRVADLESLPFEPDSFDSIIAVSSIQYAENPNAAVRELERVVAPDGRISVGLFSTADKVEYRVVFDAIRESLPELPQGRGPFALSAPGVLEELVESAGLTVVGADEVDCPFTFATMDSFWAGVTAAGPVQAALDVVEVAALRRSLEEAAGPYQRSDGSIQFEVTHRFVTAERR